MANEKMIKEMQDEAYSKGLNDAWELSKKLHNMASSDLVRIYGLSKTEYVLHHFTFAKALAKLKAYEERIEMGDVVKYEDIEYLVCSIAEKTISGKPNYCGVTSKGKWVAENEVTKTGKHIDIASILEQISEV